MITTLAWLGIVISSASCCRATRAGRRRIRASATRRLCLPAGDGDLRFGLRGVHCSARQAHGEFAADLGIYGVGDMARVVICEDLLDLDRGTRRDVERAALGPIVRASSVADRRI